MSNETSRPCKASLPEEVGTLEDLRRVNNLQHDGFRHTTDPEDLRHDNTIRAKLGITAILAYATESKSDDLDTVVSDMLADLRHAADALEIDFDDASSSAKGYYSEELHCHSPTGP